VTVNHIFPWKERVLLYNYTHKKTPRTGPWSFFNAKFETRAHIQITLVTIPSLVSLSLLSLSPNPQG
jgi:hypothetical protein